MRQSCNGVAVVMQEEQPDAISPASIWIKESTNQWFTLSNGAWVEVQFEHTGHTHTSLGDIDFTGEITVAGEHTESLKIPIKGVGTLVFTHGLLTYFEAE